MGGSSSKEVTVEYRDITSRKIREAQKEVRDQYDRTKQQLREQQQQEIARRQNEAAKPEIKIVKKDITNVKQKLAEDEARQRARRQYQHKEQQEQISEKERAALAKRAFEEIDRKRSELKDYRFGSINGLRSFGKLPVDKMHREGALRVGLFGPAGSGKSSFISTCERTMYETTRGTADIQAEGGEGTIRVCDYLCGDWDFRLVDSRGFGKYGKNELAAFADIMFGNITIGQKVEFEANSNPRPDADHGIVEDWIHAVIFVVSAVDPRLVNGRLAYLLDPMRAFLKPRGVAGITLITHQDKIGPEDYETTKMLASAATGSAKNHTFFIKNYTGEKERDHETEKNVCEILYYALMMGERYVKIAKHQSSQKEAMRSEIGDADKPSQTLDDFFEQLQKSKSLSEEKVKGIRDQLDVGGIRTTFALHTAWSMVADRVKISKLMTKYIKEALDAKHSEE